KHVRTSNCPPTHRATARKCCSNDCCWITSSRNCVDHSPDDPAIPIISRDIYNIREQLYQQNLAGRTPIQVLIDELREEDNTVYDLVEFIGRTLSRIV
ncbi:8865_t:CDS:1, partial [Cetraspora pellucida]